MKRAIAAVGVGLGVSLAGCVAAPLPACPAHDGYTDPAALTCLAGRGDKRAAYELGRLYEAGVGVSADPKRAAQLYRQAAAFTSGTTAVYMPPVGGAKYGSVIQMRTGPDAPGWPQAALALARLQMEGRGVRRDPAAACRSAERAARAGLGEAKLWMAQVGCP